MTAIPEDIREAEKARLVDLLDRRIPRAHLVVRHPGLTAIIWQRGEVARQLGLPSWVGFARRDGRPTVTVGPYREASARIMDTIIRAASAERDGPSWQMMGIWSWGLPGAGAAVRRSDRDRRRALAAVVDGLDAAAIMLMADTAVGKPSNAGLVASTEPGAWERHRMAHAHPWVGRLWSGHGGLPEMASRRHGADAGARAVMRSLAGGLDRVGDLEALVPRMRRFVSPLVPFADTHAASARLLSRVPAALFPPPLPAVGPYRPEADDDLTAFYCLAPLAVALAEESGRDVGSVVGRVGGWADYLTATGGRAGLVPTDRPDRLLHMAHELRQGLVEMARAFAKEVLAPAAMAVGGVPFADRVVREHMGQPSGGLSDDPAVAPALGLLLGRKTLPALAETCAQWHRQVGAIASAVAGIDAGMPGGGRVGPKLFEDLDLANGLYMTCLRTGRDLVDEGARGPDANGAAGLDHCVGSYLDRVVRGEIAILSIRRRVPGGYTRVSTVEVDFCASSQAGEYAKVVQHRGLRNVDPGQETSLVLNIALRKVADGAREAMSEHRRRGVVPMGVSEAIHAAGAWERIRDLWAFALTRPQRAMGPEELLREAGVPPEVADVAAPMA